MSEFFDRIKHDAFKGDYLTRLLYLNIGVYLVISVVNAFYGLFSGNISAVQEVALNWLGLPSDGFKLITRPWTFLTYMFVHLRFWHLLTNMIVLYFSGRILMEYLGQRRMLALYIYGGLGGGLLYLVLSNISPLLQSGQMIGASAGVSAVLIAGALYMPNMPVRLYGVFEIKYWWLAAGLVFLDILQLTSSNAGGHLAHLGGALVAYFFIRSMRAGNEWNVYLFQVIDMVRGMLQPGPSKKNRGFSFGEQRYKRAKSARQKQAAPTQQTSSGANMTGSDTERMDAILDKIKAKGYDSLSKEEKAFLFKISKD